MYSDQVSREALADTRLARRRRSGDGRTERDNSSRTCRPCRSRSRYRNQEGTEAEQAGTISDSASSRDVVVYTRSASLSRPCHRTSIVLIMSRVALRSAQDRAVAESIAGHN